MLAGQLPGLGPQQRRWVEDAAAVAAYHAQTAVPVVRLLLLCDDAPQFKGVTKDLALCWVHEGRHYLKQFWEYYREVLAYREQPTVQDRERLAQRFDELFSTVTGYGLLAERIAKTLAKKESLLRVLERPELPLHNNPAELGARTAEGAKAWDTFMTLGETAKKLGVSFYHYFYDTLSGARQMPRLADLIAAYPRTQSGRLVGHRLTAPLLFEEIQWHVDRNTLWIRSDSNCPIRRLQW